LATCLVGSPTGSQALVLIDSSEVSEEVE